MVTGGGTYPGSLPAVAQRARALVPCLTTGFFLLQ